MIIIEYNSKQGGLWQLVVLRSLRLLRLLADIVHCEALIGMAILLLVSALSLWLGLPRGGRLDDLSSFQILLPLSGNLKNRTVIAGVSSKLTITWFSLDLQTRILYLSRRFCSWWTSATMQIASWKQDWSGLGWASSGPEVRWGNWNEMIPKVHTV